MAARIFDFRPSDENALVERTLVQVHKAIDQLLPKAELAPQRYSKTLFSEEESTALVRAAAADEKDNDSRLPPKLPAPPAAAQNSSTSADPGESEGDLSRRGPRKGQDRDEFHDGHTLAGKELDQSSIIGKSNPSTSVQKSGSPQESRVSNVSNFSHGYEYTEPRVPSSGRDLFLIVLALVILVALGAGYWFVFEAGQP